MQVMQVNQVMQIIQETQVIHVMQDWNRVLVSLISWPGQLLSLFPCERLKFLARMLFLGILSWTVITGKRRNFFVEFTDFLLNLCTFFVEFTDVFVEFTHFFVDFCRDRLEQLWQERGGIFCRIYGLFCWIYALFSEVPEIPEVCAQGW